ncbi:hypothetical protein M2153_001043 [Pseudomonas sp. JUb96]|jgi:hypothetical protein|nr:hypothetical protein [Pseudomonas sp. JUb96]
MFNLKKLSRAAPAISILRAPNNWYQKISDKTYNELNYKPHTK